MKSIAERGGHNELIVQNGLYAEMWRQQQEAAKRAEVSEYVAAPVIGRVKSPVPPPCPGELRVTHQDQQIFLLPNNRGCYPLA